MNQENPFLCLLLGPVASVVHKQYISCVLEADSFTREEVATSLFIGPDTLSCLWSCEAGTTISARFFAAFSTSALHPLLCVEGRLQGGLMDATLNEWPELPMAPVRLAADGSPLTNDWMPYSSSSPLSSHSLVAALPTHLLLSFKLARYRPRLEGKLEMVSWLLSGWMDGCVFDCFLEQAATRLGGAV